MDSLSWFRKRIKIVYSNIAPVQYKVIGGIKKKGCEKTLWKNVNDIAAMCNCNTDLYLIAIIHNVLLQVNKICIYSSIIGFYVLAKLKWPILEKTFSFKGHFIFSDNLQILILLVMASNMCFWVFNNIFQNRWSNIL